MRITWWVALVVLCASCLSFDEVRCPDGRVCPAGSRCGDGRCISPEQLAACADREPGAECSLVGGTGTCRDGVCEPWTCGDGVLDPNEQCEREGTLLGGKTCLDFNSRTPEGLACNEDCTFDTFGCAACGDGEMQDGEQCDGTDFDLAPGVNGQIDCRDPRAGFYDAGLVQCSAICTWDVSGCTGFCGDGVVNGNGAELCDTAPPVGESCLDHGFDGGRIGCTQCGRAFAGCRALGWQRIATPSNVILRSVWATADDIFAVGDGGTILRRASGGMQTLDSGTTQSLHGAWGADASNVFFVGAAGTILRFDGATVSAMTSPTAADLRAIWGTSATDVYAVGAAGVVLHYDGTSWAMQTSNTTAELRAIWGSGSTIVAVGAAGTVVRSTNGSSWTASPPVPSPLSVTADFSGVWGTAANDVFAVTRRAEVFHFDGNAWSQQPTPTAAVAANAAISGGGSDDVFVVGPTLLHFDGSRWTRLIAPSDGSGFETVSRAANGDVWIAGASGYLARWGGASWTTATSGTTNGLRAVATTADGGAWAVGGGGTIRRYDGTSWAASSSNASALLTGVWTAGTTFAVAVGASGTLRHFDGSSWGSPAGTASSADLFGVWGPVIADIFAVGNSGTVRKFDGVSWSTIASPAQNTILLGVWGTSSTDVMAVGQVNALPLRGAIHHFGGASWTEMTTPATSYLQSIWGTASNDVFAVGDAVLHYDGTAWARLTAGGRKLRAVAGTGARNVFAVGDAGTLLHYDGIDWLPMRVLAADGSAVTANLRGVAATPRSLLVVGDGGFVQRLSFSLRPTEVNCRDAWDDDGDALPDCADPDCAADAYCTAGGACVVARTVACGEQVTGTTIGRASSRDFYTCSGNAETGGDIVYRFDATTSSAVTATLSGYTQDLDLVVVGAMPASAACDPNFACIDASATMAASETVAFTATAGETYYVIVDGNSGAAGGFTLALACP